MKFLEHLLESVIFRSRWLLAPFYLGLVAGIVLVLITFVQEFLHLLPLVLASHGEGGALTVGILSLVDLALVANLLIIIIFAGYENFVSKINTGDHEDRPEWMGHVDFSDLKMKVIGSIIAISAIELLKTFVNLQQVTDHAILAWKVGIHLTFVVSGVLFALMDWLAEKKKHG